MTAEMRVATAGDDEVVTALWDKHPGDLPSQEDVTAASSTSEPDTPPGLSSWTHHLLTFIPQALAILKGLHNLT
jgi:hypothetical protein